jgi:hypothetical protein
MGEGQKRPFAPAYAGGIHALVPQVTILVLRHESSLGFSRYVVSCPSSRKLAAKSHNAAQSKLHHLML